MYVSVSCGAGVGPIVVACLENYSERSEQSHPFLPRLPYRQKVQRDLSISGTAVSEHKFRHSHANIGLAQATVETEGLASALR